MKKAGGECVLKQIRKFSSKRDAERYAHGVWKETGFDASVFKASKRGVKPFYWVVNKNIF